MKTDDPYSGNLDHEWLSRISLIEQVHNLGAICFGNKIAYLNQAGSEMLGLDNDDRAVGSDFISFFHPDYAAISELGLEALAEDDTLLSLKFIRIDGVQVDVEMWVTYLDYPGEKAFLVEAHDITDHLRAARALRSREQRLEGIINTVADGIISLDDRGVIQTFNPAAEKIFGFSMDEAVGKNIRSLMPMPVDENTDDQFETSWATVLPPKKEVVGQRKGGDTFPMEMAVRELRQGQQLSFTSIVRDITSRKKAEDRINRMAQRDPLTRLPNRYLLGDRLEEALKRARRHKQNIYLMFIDLDGFKSINDELGHAAGDEALMIVADRMSLCLRHSDTLARVGGDEFVVVLEEIERLSDSEGLARKIIDKLGEPMDIGGHPVTIGASIGISIFPEHADDMKGLLRCSDKAMYVAKHRHGGNHPHIYNPATDDQ